jgi:hypothetical protein
MFLETIFCNYILTKYKKNVSINFAIVGFHVQQMCKIAKKIFEERIYSRLKFMFPLQLIRHCRGAPEQLLKEVTAITHAKPDVPYNPHKH